MPVTLGVVKETEPGETRVALVPDVAKRLTTLGVRVRLEKGAGSAARILDSEFADVDLGDNASEVLATTDVLLTVHPPSIDAVRGLKQGAVVIGFINPYGEDERIKTLRERGITSFAMELVPRISRAQSMDALSSQASIAGYKAVLIAANLLDKFFPMLTTPAGTIRPAQVLVIGIGVAGLQAIATAKRLGAVVEAYDVRSATKEQAESLGAKFVETGVSAEGEGGYARELTTEERERQQAALAERIAVADVVITTAAVPGRTAPRIITRQIVERMKSGAVIVDMAAESGGNCELTHPAETVEHQGVRIIGPLKLAAQVARHASEMYARNLFSFLQPALSDGELAIDWDDEVFAASVLTHAGEIKHQPTRERIEGTS